MNAIIPKEAATEIRGQIDRQLAELAMGRVDKAGLMDMLVKDPAIGGRIASLAGADKAKAGVMSYGATAPPERKSLFRLPQKYDPMAELRGLIGLDTVKAQVEKTVNLINLSRTRQKEGLPQLDLTHHLVFTGNPGTGKTTVARLVGQIYCSLGVLSSGHMLEVDRGNLIAPYVGHTALLVKNVVAHALDGVLFIDEAYSLTYDLESSKDFGPEAIQALIKLMEDYRSRLVVIVAGYTEEMNKFIYSNPGLASRFKTFIEFTDYNGAELFRIFDYMAVQSGCRLTLPARIEAAALMNTLKSGAASGNARTVRNVFEECLARQAARLAVHGRKKVDVRMLEAGDVPKIDELETLFASMAPRAKSASKES
ncbi:MAG TPA: AAA family ATPase [Patescibacteria group bacterium]|nr:AAA family ATPase [Patescibacteria group bacterium]